MQRDSWRSVGRVSLLGVGLALLLAGCRAASVQETFQPAAGESAGSNGSDGAVPEADMASYEYDSVWSYLEDRHDADGDGRVTPEEYGRDAKKFARLDGDKDGVLTAADFKESERGGMRMPRGMMARMVFMRIFNADEDDETLKRDEVQQRFADYDLDGDGLVAREEFDEVQADAAAAEQADEGEGEGGGMMARMMKRMLADRSPYDVLQAGIKTQSDEELALDEVLVFFDENDSDHDLAWSFGGSSRGGRRGAGRERAISGPAAGRVAPDFTLQPLAGGEPVTLSSFAGKKPVALIFGSYT